MWYSSRKPTFRTIKATGSRLLTSKGGLQGSDVIHGEAVVTLELSKRQVHPNVLRQFEIFDEVGGRNVYGPLHVSKRHGTHNLRFKMCFILRAYRGTPLVFVDLVGRLYRAENWGKGDNKKHS